MREAMWTAGAAVVCGYILLFILARRPVSLRLARMGWLLAILVGLRLVLAVTTLPLEGPLELTATGVVGASVVVLMLARRVWLVRDTAEGLRGQIQTVARGLFLGVAEVKPGRLELAAREKPVLRLRSLTSRVQVLVLCRVSEPGKVALLCDWLTKQYPGPIPPVRIVLKGGGS